MEQIHLGAFQQEATIGEWAQLPVQRISLDEIKPSPENDKLYRPINPRDPEIWALAQSIEAQGVLTPLVLTQDYFILSGHRRFAAAKLAGLTEAPCQIVPLCRDDPNFVPLLREYNRQRDKTHAERLREEIVSADREGAYQRLLSHRRKAAQGEALPELEIVGQKRRSALSAAKRPFLEAAQGVINRLRSYWPLSVRQIHYQLLNAPPLIHAGKPGSVYANNRACYQALSDLLTRARLTGEVPMNAIADETRPVRLYSGWENTRPFVREQLDRFLTGYYRNLQQSQPNHIEIVAEKNTLLNVLKPIASKFTLPLTIGRGYSSLPPLHAICERYRESGKEQLTLLVLSDFDPDGEEIAQSLVRSLRDDFGIPQIYPVKVALTQAQVQAQNLPPSMEAKPSSANWKKFVAKYGTHAYELEAVPPPTLQRFLREAILSVMDTAAYNAEVEREKKDAGFLEDTKALVLEELRYMDFEEEEDENSDLSEFGEGEAE